jgi:hypothetical protein
LFFTWCWRSQCQSDEATQQQNLLEYWLRIIKNYNFCTISKIFTNFNSPKWISFFFLRTFQWLLKELNKMWLDLQNFHSIYMNS